MVQQEGACSAASPRVQGNIWMVFYFFFTLTYASRLVLKETHISARLLHGSAAHLLLP